MKTLIKVLENLFIVVIIVIASLVINNFINKINKEKVDTTYMWNIKYDNLIVTDGSKNANLILNQDELEVEVSFDEELEFYEFTIDINNEGTFDAKIKNIDLNIENEKNILVYQLTYDNDNNIEIGDILESNSKRTIKLRVDYPKQETKIYDKLNIKINLNIEFESI